MNAEQAAARQTDVLGKGPRIAPLRPEELDDYALEINARIRTMANRDLGPKTLDNLPEVIGTMLRHPAPFEKITALGIGYALEGVLPPPERELAILRIGWLCGAPYEFGEHVFIGRDHGFDEERVAAVKLGPEADLWTEHERAILRAAGELHADAMIADDTWATLIKIYNPQQMIELCLVIGHYQQTAYVQNSLRMRLHPGNDGLLSA
jgi:alkylhydroperoxidase family enzyme